MKKFFAYLLLLCMIVSLTACSLTNEEDGSKIKIICTAFPQYDWVRAIAGDSENLDISLLLDNGIDLHSYDPKPGDILKISKCDMFIYVGGESEDWVESVLSSAKNKDMAVLDLLEILGEDAKEEEIKEGMESEEEEPEEEAESDEHVWLSLKNAVRFCEAIKDSLCAIDPDNSEKYITNCGAYVEKLKDLDKRYEETAAASGKKTLIFGGRFPFRYLTDDYGLDYFAAFSGCSSESSASFKTVVFLAKKIDELELKYIVVLQNSDSKIAESVRDATTYKNQEILVMNSLESVSSKNIAEGTTYIGEMENNLKILEKALG